MATELQALRSKLEVLSSNCSLLSAQLQELSSDIDTFAKSPNQSAVTDAEAEQIVRNLIADLDRISSHNIRVRRIHL